MTPDKLTVADLNAAIALNNQLKQEEQVLRMTTMAFEKIRKCKITDKQVKIIWEDFPLNSYTLEYLKKQEIKVFSDPDHKSVTLSW